MRSGGHRMRFVKALGVAVAAMMLVASGATAQVVILSVAISLKEVTEDLGRTFMASHPGVTLRYNFGASDDLQKQKLIVASSRRAFARNVLVVVKPVDSTLDLSKMNDLLNAKVTHIAIGQPKTVPAGQYAEESLRALGVWDSVQPKLVFAENVRQVLEYVGRGEVEAGFVYTTDAASRAQGVKEAFRPPDDSYRPVIYPGAVVAASKQPALALAFLDLLASPQGRAVLSRFGFQPPPAGAR